MFLIIMHLLLYYIRCADLAQAHFHTPTVIISLVLDNKQVLAAEIGWEGERDEQGNAVHPLRELPLDQEVMKRLEDDCFVIEDARADWRFNQNVRKIICISSSS